MGLSEYTGRFTGIDGSLQPDPKRVAATQLGVTIPVASVSAICPQLDGKLRSGQWPDAGRSGQMRFHSVGAIPTRAGRARIGGELTLHGVDRPVTLQARFVGAGVNPLDKAHTVGLEATGTLSRSTFGVKTYVPLIGDEAKPTLAGAFERAA